MGSCQPQRVLYYTDYSPPIYDQLSVKLSYPKSMRFGSIQSLKTKRQNIFKLIMPSNDNVNENISIDCRVMNTLADFQLYDGTKFTIQDRKISPVLDEMAGISMKEQIYHQIKTDQQKSYTLKAYRFDNYRDPVLKAAVYEIYLYNLMSNSPLMDYYIMTRGKCNTIVMIFKFYQTTLFEITQYRKLINYTWIYEELLHIFKTLLKNYLELKSHFIFHRDIRLSTIFFTPQSKNYPYEFANLQSARKVPQSCRQQLMSVKGINLVAEQPVKQKIDNGQQMANYDVEMYDRKCLSKLFISLVNLDPLQQGNKCNNQIVMNIVEMLNNMEISVESVAREVDRLHPKLSIYEEKQMLKDDQYISEVLSKQLHRVYQKPLNSAELDLMLTLHKKQHFSPLLLTQLQLNEQDDRKQQNIDLLHKVGSYYEQVGIPLNDYYTQQLNIILEIAVEFRQEEFYEDHHEYVEKGNDLYKTIQNNDRGNFIETRINLIKQNVYNLIKYQNKMEKAKNKLMELMNVSKNVNIHMRIQMEIILAKINYEVELKQFENAEETISKGQQLCGQQYLFEFKSQYLYYTALFAYWKAYVLVRIIKGEYLESHYKMGKTIGSALANIEESLQIFKNLPQEASNTLHIIRSYIVKGQIEMIRQEYQQASKQLQGGDILIKYLKQTRPVSKRLEIQLLEKLKVSYEKQNNLMENYNNIVRRLKEMKSKSQQSNSQRHKRIRDSKRRETLKEKRQVKEEEIIQEQPQQEQKEI